ncbi:MAG: hypothetical protein LIO93_03855 [Bacteroidales bacterium]|nr:hypothetical protein [Bacteroidales bacterium]
MKHTGEDKLNTKERKELPDSDFGIPETREFPIPDAQHVHAAESYFRNAPEDKKPQLARFILKKAKEFGVEVKSETIGDYAKK